MDNRLRLGRISYLNVLPIYLPLENGLGAGVHMVSGSPAELNKRMAAGELDISAVSSIEYARRWQDYLLVPNLAIGCRGPVQSVLLLSQRPPEELDGKTVLVSSQTHTSAALLQLLLKRIYGQEPVYAVGDAASALQAGDRPAAILAIGDEALQLRRMEEYPHRLDLGQAWAEWTGKPFIFGVWVASKKSMEQRPEMIRQSCRLLQRAKGVGLANIDRIASIAAETSGLSLPETLSYFSGLSYDLDTQSQEGLSLFFTQLAASGAVLAPPPFQFVATE